MEVSGIIVAAGTGSRMGAGVNKVYMPLSGKCVLWYTVKAFCECGAVSELIIVTGAADFEKCRQIMSEFDMPYKLIEGGAERQDSVMNGLRAALGRFAAVHDGARAMITPEQIRSAVGAAMRWSAAALGVAPKDTIKTADTEGFITGTVERSRAYLIQTPQVFLRDELLSAHERAKRDGISVTDDCALMEREGVRIKIVQGSYENIKLTTPEDIYTAERILDKRKEGANL